MHGVDGRRDDAGRTPRVAVPPFRQPGRSTAFAVGLVLALVASIAGLVGGVGRADARGSVSPASLLVAAHNSTRAGASLPALTRDANLDAMAQAWADHMAATGVLEHRSDLASAFSAVPGAVAVAENVGYGPDTDRIYQGFLASAGHLSNILGNYDRIGVGVATDVTGRVWVAVNFTRGGGPAALPSDGGPGYWITSSDGKVWRGNGAASFGDLAGLRLNLPVVGATGTASGQGYWLVASDGGIFAFGDAGFYGSTGSIRLNQPIVGMATTPSGKGYWLVASDGGIFAFGDAGFYGSTGSIRLNQPIVGMAATPTGQGYWLVASDGGMFAFGDARFHGSGVGVPNLAPVVGMAAMPTGNGYWLVGANGTIAAFGDAPAPFMQVRVNAQRASGLTSGAGVRVVDNAGRVVTFTATSVSMTPPLQGVGDIVAIANAPG